MPLVPQELFQFCGPSNLAESPVIDCQRSINLYPTPGLASSKTHMGLVGRPGLSVFGDPSGGAKGHSLWAGNSRLFAAIGQNVYEVNSSGGVITNYGTGLTNLGPYPTPMIGNGTQLLIVDSFFASIFNVNPGGPSLDLVFTGTALEYLDGFYIAIAFGASLAGTNPNQINASKNGDGTTWPALSFAIRTGTADLAIQLAVLNGLIYIFGQKSIEIWYDAGTSPFPFARVNGGTINLGCLAAASVVKFSNTILWLGGDDRGYAQVYMMQGMNPVKVSNPAIESMLATANVTSKLFNSKAYGYQEAGHTFYVLQLCNGTSNTMQTLVYDLTTGLWHERAYGALIPTQLACVWNYGTTSVGNFTLGEATGKIYTQSVSYPNDDGAAITYTRIAPHVGTQNKWFKYPRFELDGDIGTAAPILDYSNNGGRSFLGYNYPMTQAQDQGAPGTFKRFFALQLGRSRDRVFKTTITDSTNLIRIANAYLTAEATT